MDTGPSLLPGLRADSSLGAAVREIEAVDARGVPEGFVVDRVVCGADPMNLGLNIVVARDEQGVPPSAPRYRSLHRWRVGKTTIPVVAAVTTPDGKWWLQGPSAAASPVGPFGAEQVERMLNEALREPSGAASRARIAGLLVATADSNAGASGPAHGVNNSGLFAMHYLREILPTEDGWTAAAQRSKACLPLRAHHLVQALGFRIRREGSAAVLLQARHSAVNRAVAVLLEEDEHFDGKSSRFRVSPVAHGLRVAQQRELPWLIALRGSQTRLYPARPGVGVGSRGLTGTYFELDLATLEPEWAAYLDLVFSAEALEPEGGVQRILSGSRRYTQGLGDRLRTRVYEEVMPALAVAVARETGGRDLEEAYRITLLILFRLLFQAYAEDRGHLPCGRNDIYDRHSLKQRALDLLQEPDLADESHALWAGLRTVWNVIDTGDRGWDVPPYNGGLFGRDPALHGEGAIIEALRLDNRIVGRALERLLIDTNEDGDRGPIDFRELSIREFGTLYEGLIESTVARAPCDLTRDPEVGYRPARDGESVEVPEGEPFFRDVTGERKATGTYFTPEFAVRHLLEHALDKALDSHLERVSAFFAQGDDASAADAFFDFRVADIAMGSGHFLIAAVDHIEARMSAFLTETPIPAVVRELDRLHAASAAALDRSAEIAGVETTQLLRRQIARRCVYGVDQNPIAVDLARVAMWLHTFVPGLPMSSLDHNLVRGNSLTGIDSVDTAVDALDPSSGGGQLSIFRQPIEDALSEAREVLRDAAKAAEASKAEVLHSAAQFRKARERAQTARLLFDAALAARLGKVTVETLSIEEITALAQAGEVRSLVNGLDPAHFPFLFPEVFLRDNGGFDVLVGNPPWEKVKIERQQWWGKHLPGIRSLSVGKMNAAIREFSSDRPDLELAYTEDMESTRAMATHLKALYSGMGSGDTDLYKAFAWRFWQLIRSSGHLSIVLPRSALSGAGLPEWRLAILDGGAFDNVTTIVNTGQWLFEDVHPQFGVALVVVRSGTEDAGTLRLRGPCHNPADYAGAMSEPPIKVSADEFKRWSGNASFPSFPTPQSVSIFRKMLTHPLFGAPPPPKQNRRPQANFRPATELHATLDRHRFILDAGASALSGNSTPPTTGIASSSTPEPAP